MNTLKRFSPIYIGNKYVDLELHTPLPLFNLFSPFDILFFLTLHDQFLFTFQDLTQIPFCLTKASLNHQPFKKSLSSLQMSK